LPDALETAAAEKAPDGFIDLFDRTAPLRHFNLEISPAELDALHRQPTHKRKRPCNLTVNFGQPDARTFRGSRCNYKGNMSLILCTNVSTGELTHPWSWCRKPSWKIRAPRAQSIFGFSQLAFNNMVTDHSLSVNRLAFTTLRELAGMNVSRVVPMVLYINGAFDGVYDLFEEMDQGWFDRRHLEDGALYENGWPFFEDPHDYAGFHVRGSSWRGTRRSSPSLMASWP
jgi:hypothetical protein